MTGEMVKSNDVTFYVLVDELTAFAETLDMLDAQLEGVLESDDRRDIEQARIEVRASIERIHASLSNKTDAIAMVLRRMGTESEVIKAERDRLKTRAQSYERAERWLRDYVVSVMQKNGVRQLKTSTNTLFVRQSESVEITDIEQISDEYQNAEVKVPLSTWRRIVAELPDLDVVRIKAEPSLSTIKKAIKSGVDIPGADLRFKNGLVCR